MRLTRRELIGTATAGASAMFGAAFAQTSKDGGLTHEVAAFIVNTTYKDLPEDVVELGRKSILDGLGLALSGSVAETGRLSREYVASLGISRGPATIIGSPLTAP